MTCPSRKGPRNAWPRRHKRYLGAELRALRGQSALPHSGSSRSLISEQGSRPSSRIPCLDGHSACRPGQTLRDSPTCRPSSRSHCGEFPVTSPSYPFLLGDRGLYSYRLSYGVMHRLPRVSPDLPIPYRQFVIPPGVSEVSEKKGAPTAMY